MGVLTEAEKRWLDGATKPVADLVRRLESRVLELAQDRDRLQRLIRDAQFPHAETCALNGPLERDAEILGCTCGVDDFMESAALAYTGSPAMEERAPCTCGNGDTTPSACPVHARGGGFNG